MLFPQQDWDENSAAAMNLSALVLCSDTNLFPRQHLSSLPLQRVFVESRSCSPRGCVGCFALARPRCPVSVFFAYLDRSRHLCLLVAICTDVDFDSAVTGMRCYGDVTFTTSFCFQRHGSILINGRLDLWRQGTLFAGCNWHLG